LYLLKNDKNKGTPLSERAATLLGRDAAKERKITNLVKRFYNLRNDIIHASFIDDVGSQFLGDNIYKYEDILRKSILAFLDLNKRAPTKKQIIKILNDARTNPMLSKDIHDHSQLLKMAE
jgi:hypothetical protein